MNLLEAMEARHAVRNFTDAPIDADALAALQREIDACNAEGDLNIQLIHDADDALDGCTPHYGRFSGVHNLIALIGADDDDPVKLDKKTGYYGQRLAIAAVAAGLDTCWLVLHDTDEHGAWTIAEGERMPAAIALGHAVRPGRPHRSKPAEELSSIAPDSGISPDQVPDWFTRGVEAAMLAPSALGKQPFHLTLLDDHTVLAEALDGLQPTVTLGTVKYNFELAAGAQNFTWA